MYENERLEIDALRKYLLSHIPVTPLPPNNILLSPTSIALRAAIAGLDKELGRLEREERLVRKFTNENTVYSGCGTAAAATSSSSSTSTAVHNTTADEDVAMEYVKMTKEDAENAIIPTTATTMKRENNVDDEEDWEEAEASPTKKESARTDSQDIHEKIAQKWAFTTISRISKADARVETPIGALGLALHTALVELINNSNYNEGNKGNKKTAEPMFRCTGVPDEAIISQFLGEGKKKSGGAGGISGIGGFAPPIRELPKGVLLPSNWEDSATNNKQGADLMIAFRYKCGQDVYTTSSGPTNDCTTLYLVLQLLRDDSSTVKVFFGPMPASSSSSSLATTKSTSHHQQSNQLQFPLTRHINLDGFNAHKSKSSASVQPSLFFISLPELLCQFGSTFGLTSVMQSTFGGGLIIKATVEKKEEEEGVGEDTVMDTSMNMKGVPNREMFTQAVNDDANFVPRPVIPPDGPAVDMTDPLRIIDSRTGMMGRRRGDFEGDLLPGGPQPGLLPGADGPPPFGGSQVGPNHPIFDRSFGVNDQDETYYGPPSFGLPGVGGGMGMHPRFDPYGPPGGPTEPSRRGRGAGRGFGSGRGQGGRGRGSVPPGGFGDPNPDHMRPPNSDYYS